MCDTMPGSCTVHSDCVKGHLLARRSSSTTFSYMCEILCICRPALSIIRGVPWYSAKISLYVWLVTAGTLNRYLFASDTFFALDLAK